MVDEPSWRRTLLLGGLALLLLPPVGWLLALGYRSLVGSRMVEGRAPVLPAWRGHVWAAFQRGMATSGVILAYLSPFLLAFGLLGTGSLDTLLAHRRELAYGIAAVVLFPPLFVPTLPLLAAFRYEWLQFSPPEIVLLAGLFFGAIGLLPAAFMQVALRGSFRAASHLGAAVRLVAHTPRVYVEAWVVSLGVSLGALAAGPLAPWALFWSYLVISHLFLQVLASWDTPEVRVRFSQAPLPRGSTKPPNPALQRPARVERWSAAAERKR